MTTRRRISRTLKWGGTIAFLFLSAAFLFSIRRSVDWHSADLRYEVQLVAGSIAFGWRPAGWTLENERYPPTAGWGGIASYGWNKTEIFWWFQRSANPSWEGRSVPLWPFCVAIAIPTTWLWYRDRRHVSDFLRRLVIRMRPRHGVRFRARHVILSLVFHICCLSFIYRIAWTVALFFFCTSTGAPGKLVGLVSWCHSILFFGTPVWIFVWAWIWVRLRNELLRRYPTGGCLTCGYDLTGNVSGKCPECGTTVPVNSVMLESSTPAS